MGRNIYTIYLQAAGFAVPEYLGTYSSKRLAVSIAKTMCKQYDVSVRTLPLSQYRLLNFSSNPANFAWSESAIGFAYSTPYMTLFKD